MSTIVEEIREMTGVDLARCGACEDCTARFALKGRLDLSPYELIRRALADDCDAVFGSRSLWLLSGSQARHVVCEQGLPFGRVLGALRKLALDAGATPAERDVAHLMTSFRDQIRSHGRLHNHKLLKEMRRRLDAPATDAAQEIALLLRGKLRLHPTKVKDIEAVRRALEGKEDET